MKNITKMIQPSGKWSAIIKKGKLIKISALEKGANLALLMYNKDDLTERYNMPDTLKSQHTAHLTTGNVLMSDNGRVLSSIVEDSLGWHDTISGITTRQSTYKKYGEKGYQNYQNSRHTNGFDNFSVELVRNGLSVRDIVPSVNVFSKVQCDEVGNMHYIVDHCFKGASVTFRTEMNILLILSNTPNPLDKREVFSSVPIHIEISEAKEVGLDDVCVTFRKENKRAFENTWDYNTLTN